MSEWRERFLAEWERFADAFESRDHDAALTALQGWILAWDKCFWREELDVFAEVYAPNVVVVNHLPFPGMSDFQGVGGFTRLRADVADAVSIFRFEVSGLEWEGDRFAGFGHLRARGRFSRLVIRFPGGVVWTYAERRITRIETFGSHRGARAHLRASATAVS